MRIVVTGGGTGGHIYPALSICKRISTALPDSEILYVGSKYGLENTILPNENIKYKAIDVKGFDRSSVFLMIKAFFMLFKALYQSNYIMAKFRPDLVIGMGGYVSGPVVFMAYLHRIKTFIHEQNAVPGLTTHILSKFATRVLISYKDSAQFFKNKNNVFYTGNPVRREFSDVNRDDSRTKYGLNKDDKLILSMGGSGGSLILNKMAVEVAKYVSTHDNIYLCHIAGKKQDSSFISEINAFDNSGRIKILEYSDDMHNLMGAADLCIGRAGAISLAEMATVKLPGILIPSPNVANDHQTKNANVFSRSGACSVIKESALTSEKLVAEIDRIITNEDVLNDMRLSYGGLTKENALDTIVSMVYDCYLN